MEKLTVIRLLNKKKLIPLILLTALVGCADSDKNNIFDCTSTYRDGKLTATVSFKKKEKGEVLYFNSLPFIIAWSEGSDISADLFKSDGSSKMELHFRLEDAKLYLIDDSFQKTMEYTLYYCKLR